MIKIKKTKKTNNENPTNHATSRSALKHSNSMQHVDCGVTSLGFLEVGAQLVTLLLQVLDLFLQFHFLLDLFLEVEFLLLPGYGLAILEGHDGGSGGRGGLPLLLLLPGGIAANYSSRIFFFLILGSFDY